MERKRIEKIRRGHWSVNAGPELPYCSVHLTSEHGNRPYGWQVHIRDKDGRKVRHVGTYPRRGPATRAALDALGIGGSLLHVQ